MRFIDQLELMESLGFWERAMEKRYDIALSYAEEDRAYVEQVAQLLQQSGISVFYDRFEEAALWGKDLYAHLQHVYRDSSKYTIIFCSKSYAQKRWTTHELKSAQERAFKEHSEYILPARFDETEIPGISSLVGYINLSQKPPEEFCKLIAEKLGRPLNDAIYENPVDMLKSRQITEIRDALTKDPFINLTNTLYCCPQCGSTRLIRKIEHSPSEECDESEASCQECAWTYDHRYWHAYRYPGCEQTLEGTMHHSNPLPQDY